MADYENKSSIGTALAVLENPAERQDLMRRISPDLFGKILSAYCAENFEALARNFGECDTWVASPFDKSDFRAFCEEMSFMCNDIDNDRLEAEMKGRGFHVGFHPATGTFRSRVLAHSVMRNLETAKKLLAFKRRKRNKG